MKEQITADRLIAESLKALHEPIRLPTLRELWEGQQREVAQFLALGWTDTGFIAISTGRRCQIRVTARLRWQP